jgi:hypothetical protein
VEKIAAQEFEGGVRKNLWLCRVGSLGELAEAIGKPAGRFVLLLAMDAAAVGDEEIERAADELLERGLSFACAWGPQCERVENGFDRADERRIAEITEKNVVLTTSHAAEELTAAVWYFRYCAWPAEEYEAGCTEWIAAVVGNAEWEQALREALTQDALA